MKTSIVGKISKRYLVATVAAIMAVTGVGATSSKFPEAEKEKNASAEQIATAETITVEEDSTPDSVTTDVFSVSVQEHKRELDTSIVDSAISEITKNVVLVSTKSAIEKTKKQVEENNAKETEAPIQINEEVNVPFEFESTEELVEDFGEDEKAEDTDSVVEDDSSTSEEDKEKKETENSESSDASEEIEESEVYEQVSQTSPYSNHLTKFKGISYFTDESGVTHRESYYDMYMGGVVSIMRNQGFSEEEYPYWVDEIRGTKMLGPYIMIAANLNNHPRGSIVDTDLGKAIVCDTGGFSYTHTEGYDIAVDWDTHWGLYPGYNC